MSVHPRPCDRQCVECHQWKHHSRFHIKRRGNSTDATKIWFSSRCRDCEQKTRNERKNADRPKAIIEQRARTAASKAGESLGFFWIQMNYRALVPELRVMMTEEGLCKGCGHKFENERDIQIEHIEPPRFENDWANLHARNLRLCCASCNRTKGQKPFQQWLDEQEGARLSHLKVPNSNQKTADEVWHQPDLFEF
jgi:HNH endonuclease